jgi:protein KRI1
VKVATNHFCNLNTNMAGTKEKKQTNGAKRGLNGDERPAKKAKLLDNTDDEGSDSDNGGGVALKINDEYATRYEHNKKRAERQKCMCRRLVSGNGR